VAMSGDWWRRRRGLVGGLVGPPVGGDAGGPVGGDVGGASEDWSVAMSGGLVDVGDRRDRSVHPWGATLADRSDGSVAR
jgi:hypothetical protein